jgi:amino acid transporter
MQPRDHSSLPRRLGLWTSIAVVVGSTIGSGIFRTPSGIAEHLPGPLPMLGVWAAGGLLVLCGALTLAEVAGALPNTGGIYVFVREGWGRLAAFLFGWTQLVMVRAAALGALAITFAEYLLRVLDRDQALAPYVAAAAIAITCVSNILGIRFGAAIQNLTTLAKYGGLVVIIVLALTIGLPATGGHYTPLAPAGSFSVAAFGLALVSILWAYDGWADLSFVGGEVTNPRRNLPRALILGTLAVIAIYLLANLAYLAVLPMDKLRQSSLVAADAVEQVWPGAGLVFVATTVMISTFGTLNATTLTAPRIFYAMADDKLFFRRVAAVHPQFQTPYVAIIIVGSIGILFVLYSPITHLLHRLDLPMLRIDPSAAAETFTRLTDAFVTAMVPFYALGVAAVFPLRRNPAYNPAFRVPGYPVVPALFIASSVLILVNAVVDPSSRWMTIGVLAVILLGIPVYYFTVARNETGAPTRGPS